MCVKLPPKDLNPNSCPSHPTSTYIYKVIIAPRVCNGKTKQYEMCKIVIDQYIV